MWRALTILLPFLLCGRLERRRRAYRSCTRGRRAELLRCTLREAAVPWLRLEWRIRRSCRASARGVPQQPSLRLRRRACGGGRQWQGSCHADSAALRDGAELTDAAAKTDGLAIQSYSGAPVPCRAIGSRCPRDLRRTCVWTSLSGAQLSGHRWTHGAAAQGKRQATMGPTAGEQQGTHRRQRRSRAVITIGKQYGEKVLHAPLGEPRSVRLSPPLASSQADRVSSSSSVVVEATSVSRTGRRGHQHRQTSRSFPSSEQQRAFGWRVSSQRVRWFQKELQLM
jgi:hypothetical protein